MSKILWIDDNPDTLDNFIDLAYVKYKLIIECCKTSKLGMEKLEEDLFRYDAVILDAKGFNESEDEVTTLKGMQNSIYKLKELSTRRYIPSVIYTGQMDLASTSTFHELIPGIKVFIKGIDRELMFEYLLTEIAKLPETQIRINHKDIFSIFTLNYLPTEVEHQVLQLLKLELPENRTEIKAMLANIRSIHESCFLKLEEIKVIPNAEATFNSILKHLSGNKTAPNFDPTTTEFQNSSIENLHKWIYFTCSQYIHNLKDEKYKGYMISKYAVESLRSGILEILLWFKKTYEENK